MSSTTPPITMLLSQAKGGDERAANELMPLIYDELRRIARLRLKDEHGPRSVEPTDVVHEAYLRLMHPGPAPWQDRHQFFAIAARVMRQVLVDHARKRAAEKRGGSLERVELNETLLIDRRMSIDCVSLDDALNRLEEIDPRQARIVELRFFAGLKIKETAEALGISETTVKDDWALAAAWLHRQLED